MPAGTRSEDRRLELTLLQTDDRTRSLLTATERRGAHVCIDDASRIAFSQILPDEKKESAIAFLKAALAYYASLGSP